MRHHYTGEMWQRVMHRDLAAHTLALAAQQVLCTGPLLVAVSPVLAGLGLGTVVELLTQLFGLDAAGTHALSALFQPDGHPDPRTLLVSALISLTFGISVASTMQRMLETMWDIDRAPFSAMWRQLVWLAALLPVLGVAIWASHALRQPSWSESLAVVVIATVAGVASAALALWSQWLLLCGRIQWRRLVPGSVMVGLAVMLVSVVSGVVVPNEVVDQSEKYGPIGAGFVLAGWVVAVTAAIATGVLAGAVLDERRLRLAERRAAMRGGRPQAHAARRARRRYRAPGNRASRGSGE